MDKNERRHQLLVAARDVFAKRGYHAAKIDEIVTAAKVARGTFYLYFEDKRAVFEEIVDGVTAKLEVGILRVDPQDPVRSVADQVSENIRRIVRMMLEDRPTTKILLSDAWGVDPSFDRKLHAFYVEMTTLLEESLREGQALGVVESGDPRIMAHLTVGALKELLYQVVVGDWEMADAVIVQAIFDFLLKGVLRFVPPSSRLRRVGKRNKRAPSRKGSIGRSRSRFSPCG